MPIKKDEIQVQQQFTGWLATISSTAQAPRCWPATVVECDASGCARTAAHVSLGVIYTLRFVASNSLWLTSWFTPQPHLLGLAGMQLAAPCTTAPQSSNSSCSGSATASCCATATLSAQQKQQHGCSTAAAAAARRRQLPAPAAPLPPRSQLPLTALLLPLLALLLPSGAGESQKGPSL